MHIYSDLKQTLSAAGMEKIQGRRTWADGGFTDFTVVRFPADRLAFRDIDQTDPQVKVNTLGQLRHVKARSFGRERPRILLWLRLSPDQPAARLFPGISHQTEQGETLLSSNSLITHTLRTLLARGWLSFEAGRWRADIPDGEDMWRARAGAILVFLMAENRLHLYPGPDAAMPDQDDLADVHPTQDLIPLDRLGFVREVVWRERPRLALNTAYFLLEHNDFFSHHSALGEGYNLFVADGEIRRPPLYRRSTLWQGGDGGWAVDTFGLDDVRLTFPGVGDGGHPPLDFTLNQADEVTAYTRLWAVAQTGLVQGTTPTDPERVEFTVVDRRVVGVKAGGGLAIPQNGFVLSIQRQAMTPALRAALEAGQVGYQFRAQDRPVRQAIQVGPRLLRGGQVTLDATTLAQEEFWMDRTLADGVRITGVVPTDYPDDVDRTRAGRVGLGITASGELMAGVMMGAETRGVKNPAVDSAGATLVELADLMAEHGAVDAVNMDGGGSSQLFFLGGATTVPGNRLGLQAVHYERMVPAIALIASG